MRLLSPDLLHNLLHSGDALGDYLEHTWTRDADGFLAALLASMHTHPERSLRDFSEMRETILVGFLKLSS